MLLYEILSILIPYIKEKKNIKTIKIKTPKTDTIFFNTIEFILVLAVILSFYLTFEVKTQRVIYIPQGSTNSIISYLDKKNYDVNYLDKILLRFIGQPQSGWIDLKSQNMTKIEFLYKLTTSKAALKKITLIPGETYYFFLQELAQKLNISTYKLFDQYSIHAYKKDGNILADTYYLPIGMDEKQLIQHLFKITDNRYKQISKKIFGIYNKKNWYRYITIASIIQKESASKGEMPLISSVIYNRIDKNMKLQMDGVLNYSKYSHTKITPKMIKEDESEYNTYKNKGLPQNPVCAVELAAIKAAIFPTKSDYLYFVKSYDGTKHNFSSSYKTHKQNIRKLKKANKRKSKNIKKTTIKKKVVKQTVEKSMFTPVKTTTNLKDLWK
ncbi:MAG: endolytic transglycosylase MltG [Campylobacterota bacterium]|nr:endolytic transglycosylase MltG [Campylobacterota bacterium]